MKKIIISLLLSSVMLLSSCADFLNMPPRNTKVVYKMSDVKDGASMFLYSTLNGYWANGYVGYYVRFNGEPVTLPFNRYASVLGSMSSDDMDMTIFIDPNVTESEKARGGNQYLKDYEQTRKWDSYLFGERVWIDAFKNVGFLNTLLRDLEKVPDYNKVDYERISGELRVFRAWYLLRLNQLFAPYNNNDLGIPYNLDADVYRGGARHKQTDLYRELIGELTDVLKLETEPRPTWNVLYNHRIIKAILAQTYMYKAESCAKESGDWAKAEQYAREARNGERVESSLAEHEELIYVPESKVIDKNHSFCLLRISILGDESTGSHNWYAPYGNPATELLQAPSGELYNLYDDTDVRKGLYFANKDGKPFFLKRKQLGNINSYNYNPILFRHSEMLLIEAEAMARQGNTAGAKTLLEEFKRAKISDFTSYTGNDLIGEIITERRKEFVLEEQMRWIDMKRTGVTFSRNTLNTDNNTIEKVTLAADDYRYTLPIPASVELNFNNIPQNPGWLY